MRSPKRRRRQKSRAVAVLGNVLLIIATLAVAGLVAYLVLNPPGATDQTGGPAIVVPTATSVGVAPTSGAPATSGGAAPTSSGIQPSLSVSPGELGLDTACASLNPLLDRADDVRNQAIEDSSAVDTAALSQLTSELNTVSDISPQELQDQIDILNGVLLDLNNEILAEKLVPDIDDEAAESSTSTMRDLCG